MPKAPATRAINNEQLISGHMRIDLLKPLTKGNFILFKGDRNTGKTSLAISIIKNFLEKSGPDAKVVYVGMSQKGKELKNSI
jgi:F0F1-type ATP synthase alpha subunit